MNRLPVFDGFSQSKVVLIRKRERSVQYPRSSSYKF